MSVLQEAPGFRIAWFRHVRQGLELSIDAALTDQLSLVASVAYADAQYSTLIDAGSSVRTGNRPINTPSTTANGIFVRGRTTPRRTFAREPFLTVV